MPISADSAYRYRPLPLDCKRAIFISYIQWLIFLLIGNTMKNTMLRKCFKMLEMCRLISGTPQPFPDWYSSHTPLYFLVLRLLIPLFTLKHSAIYDIVSL
ncbi:MAG: hypothetical protein FHK78_17200 [Sedimenticola selenatireducens]|uniref:Uncharacterized protein n=1 Tax=Sedimenticola selenatireducens TaxID=191960 RepID=A0A558DKJ0_9GAMM|nr:hypothetical protein FHP88_14410 [Sedimenticola selenatireducens]TVT61517.1 MAG: hypothetical protein FHK78_17200 [Sedimenticola selenatireducens]